MNQSLTRVCINQAYHCRIYWLRATMPSMPKEHFFKRDTHIKAALASSREPLHNPIPFWHNLTCRRHEPVHPPGKIAVQVRGQVRAYRSVPRMKLPWHQFTYILRSTPTCSFILYTRVLGVQFSWFNLFICLIDCCTVRADDLPSWRRCGTDRKSVV